MCPSSADRSLAQPELSFSDTDELLEKLGPVASELVLVGGQALNFWVDYFQPKELAGRVFTSKDVDFFGSVEHARRASEALAGIVRLPTWKDHPTPHSAVVTYTDSTGAARDLDFLVRLAGLLPAEVEQTAIPIQGRFRVLDPYLCLKSRAANVVELGRHDEHPVQQLVASVRCMNAYLAQLFAEAPRRCFDMIETLAKYASSNPNALGVYFTHGVDVFAIPDLSHETFIKRRLPQLIARLARERSRRAPRPV